MSCLRAFEAAARHLSFKHAADELGVTPTAISHQIRLLEEICGRPLFRRRPRPLALSPEGEQLFPVIRSGFDVFAMTLASIADQHVKPSPLRITSPNAFASRWLVPRLPQWRAAHPSTPIEIIGTDKVLDLRAGEADVAIRYAKTMPSDSPSVELFRDNYYPVCHPGLFRHNTTTRASDVLQYPLIHFDWFRRDPEAPTWQKWIGLAGSVDPQIREPRNQSDVTFREELHAIDAVLAGQGIAICSDLVVGDYLQNGTLIKAHDLYLPGYGFYLTHSPAHPKQTMIASFAAWLQSQSR